MNVNKLILLIIYIIGIQEVTSQNLQTKPTNWNLSGYTRSLQGLYGIDSPSLDNKLVLNDAFIHSRLNFKYYFTDKITFKADLRTRFFFGELSKSDLFPEFKANLSESSNDILDLELINTGENAVLHSVFDRLYGEYVHNDLEIRAGRQRINWGVHPIWNPNDIFNAFSVTDFDYSERPGSDAVRVVYYTGASSSLEIAVKAFDDSDNIVAGFLWKTNKWNYDFQFLGGWVNNDITIGVGWSGAIKKIGFNGEGSFFKATDDNNNNKDVLTGTLGFDYTFKNGFALGIGGLYNGNETEGDNLFAFELSAKNLYPYKWTTYTTISYAFTPILAANLTTLYSPVESNPLFINPTITYSLAQNIDLDLIGQFVFQNSEDLGYFSPTQIGYLRITWNF
ncbi:hypothetical protein D1818_14130 [Aquimarina sp. BL5]|uniref:hypothetical protein n=1 Tax=Aquimarina sp. BL5 TaxID=1714860 RepID=UPI000E49EA17|nr:hypothetical protein [Aquimarina sp. BL5]AXT51930.1 hypothetical protein D1818_14130 [Aquimarina sp. BL5]RKM93418.1 hypothetical protein D7036_22350 [Aquimarina sp. BL5]